jgi:hypothetical protein
VSEECWAVSGLGKVEASWTKTSNKKRWHVRVPGGKLVRDMFRLGKMHLGANANNCRVTGGTACAETAVHVVEFGRNEQRGCGAFVV